MSDTQAIKVLIADDEPGMRLILRKMIARVEGYELVGEAQDGEQLIALFEQHRMRNTAATPLRSMRLIIC